MFNQPRNGSFTLEDLRRCDTRNIIYDALATQDPVTLENCISVLADRSLIEDTEGRLGVKSIRRIQRIMREALKESGSETLSKLEKKAHEFGLQESERKLGNMRLHLYGFISTLVADIRGPHPVKPLPPTDVPVVRQIPDDLEEIARAPLFDVISFAFATEDEVVFQNCIHVIASRSYIHMGDPMIGKPPLPVLNAIRSEVAEGLNAFGYETLWQLQLKAREIGWNYLDKTFHEIRGAVYGIKGELVQAFIRDVQLGDLETYEQLTQRVEG